MNEDTEEFSPSEEPENESPTMIEDGPAQGFRLSPTQGDPSHVFVGTDWRGDVWQLVDAGGNVLEWAVAPGDDSRNVISGSLVNLGKPSSMSIAGIDWSAYLNANPDVKAWAESEVASGRSPSLASAAQYHYDRYGRAEGRPLNPIATPTATTTPAPAPTAATSEPLQNSSYSNAAPGQPVANGAGTGLPGGTVGGPKQGDSRHVYVGRDSRGDVWQTIDAGGNVIEWAVAPGDDSRNVRQSTIRNLGPASSMTVAQPNGPINNLAGGTAPLGSSGTGPTQINSAPANNTAPRASTAGTAAAPGRKTDPRHQYVGRDNSGDVWRLVDEGGNVVQWSVMPGGESGVPLAGTIKIIGSGQPPYVAPAGSGNSNASAGLGLIAVVGILSQLIN